MFFGGSKLKTGDFFSWKFTDPCGFFMGFLMFWLKSMKFVKLIGGLFKNVGGGGGGVFCVLVWGNILLAEANPN